MPAGSLVYLNLLACVLTPLVAKDAENSRWVHDGRIMEPFDALRAPASVVAEVGDREGRAGHLRRVSPRSPVLAYSR